jgi:hypothetical protein
MRALSYKSRTKLLTAILASCWCVSPQISHGNEPVVPNVRTESIPESNIPLPNIKPHPEQKPTSALYSAQEIVATPWQIASDILDAGVQKTVQTNCVSADCISAPQGVELPSCDTPDGAERRETVIVSDDTPLNQVDGVQKPASSPMPGAQEIVQVQWSIKPIDEIPTSYRNSVAFQADRCPIVVWNSEDIDESLGQTSLDIASLESDNEVSSAEYQPELTSVASIEIQDSPSVNPQALKELQKLASDSESGVTYLSDLKQLLGGESQWLYGNGELLDLAPEEGTASSDSYIDDLNALIPKENATSTDTGYHQTAVRPQTFETTAPPSVPGAPKAPVKAYTSIAPDPNCNGSNGSGVSAIFQSMSSIRLNGLSTSPPSRPRDAVALTAELPRPENRACQYLDAYSPMYYATPARYGAFRPCRDTHVFWHRPLYFEDANLERCGQASGCLTTAASTVHFAALITFSPFLLAAEHPADCVRSLPDCPTCHHFE